MNKGHETRKHTNFHDAGTSLVGDENVTFFSLGWQSEISDWVGRVQEPRKDEFIFQVILQMSNTPNIQILSPADKQRANFPAN
jgi:hypothetical protein